MNNLRQEILAIDKLRQTHQIDNPEFVDAILTLFTDRLKLIQESLPKKKTESKTITDWWICSEFFAQGGKKIAGPFKSRKTALKARQELEKKTSTTYAIDSTKRKSKRVSPLGYNQALSECSVIISKAMEMK